MVFFCFFFFFQAEDGIRDFHVTGVQTCALPISNSQLTPAAIKTSLFGSACTQNTSPSCPTGPVPNNTFGHGRIDALTEYNTVYPNFSLSTSPSALSLVAGTSGSAKITVNSVNGFNSLVSH